jgi:hypothetical protein
MLSIRYRRLFLSLPFASPFASFVHALLRQLDLPRKSETKLTAVPGVALFCLVSCFES